MRCCVSVAPAGRRPHYDQLVTVSRRQFTKGLAAAGVAVALERWLGAQVLQPVSAGRLVRVMPLGRFDGRPVPPLMLEGLDEAAVYKLTWLDGRTQTLSGAALMHRGLQLNLRGDYAATSAMMEKQ